jgi:pseudaminic acid cytidylyltransferase
MTPMQVNRTLPMLTKSTYLSLEQTQNPNCKCLASNTHLEVREEGQDELISCYNFTKDYNCETFILLPVTQPFRDINLIQICYSSYKEADMKGFDFITSFIEIPNRERFYLEFNDNIPSFKNKHNIRKGEACSNINDRWGYLYDKN